MLATFDKKDYAHCAIGRGPKMKNGPIDKILRIQLGLYIRKPGKKSLTQKKLILNACLDVPKRRFSVAGASKRG